MKLETEPEKDSSIDLCLPGHCIPATCVLLITCASPALQGTRGGSTAFSFSTFRPQSAKSCTAPQTTENTCTPVGRGPAPATCACFSLLRRRHEYRVWCLAQSHREEDTLSRWKSPRNKTSDQNHATLTGKFEPLYASKKAFKSIQNATSRASWLGSIGSSGRAL